MNGKLIKPYEISVWEEQPTENGITEKKLAIIGSDTMTGLNKIYEPVFNKKTNGEKTLTFSLKYKYYDPESNKEVENPFIKYLTNERKVKLFYDNKWYEFIIKEHTESSEENTWEYTCNDAFVLELSKTGYNITFDAELNNNQGTAYELAQKTLENTDWQVGKPTVGKQVVAEPVYKARLETVSGIEIINASGNEEDPPLSALDIYVFYSYVKNKSGKFVQFIIRDESRKYIIDDNNVITDTNFRIITNLVYKEKTEEIEGQEVIIKGFWLENNNNDTLIIAIGETEDRYQVNRLAYNQLVTYDPIMERTVDRFKAGDREIYRYIDYVYTTSNVVINYITNGDNFNILEDGSLQGWNPYTDQSDDKQVNKLELVTKPELKTGADLVDLALLSQIEGFLKIQFNGPISSDDNKIYNTVYNSGVENNASFVESISKGQQFIFRWRGSVGEVSTDPTKQATNLRVMVAKYTQDEPTRFGFYYKHIKPEDVIVEFDGVPQVLNNEVTNGYIRREEVEEKVVENYIVDGVAQTISTKYIYYDNNDKDEEGNPKPYIWNGLEGKFDPWDKENSDNYSQYYYLIGTAKKSISNTVLKDATTKIGIFVYTLEESEDRLTHYIQDIQLTRYIADNSTPPKPIITGNIPVAKSESTEYYYLKPADGAAAEDVITYNSLNELKSELGITDEVKALYNENSEKYLSISASQSNCFDILQKIAETFECWVDLQVGHDSKGYIEYIDNKPQKYVYLKEYVGNSNYAGFKYGINLQSIQREINSDEIVTKLIVDQTQSDYTDEGFVSISSAKSNLSKESYILNFNYYYSQGLLDRDKTEKERLDFITQLNEINTELSEKEKQRIELEKSFINLGSQRNFYTELIESAKELQNQALEEFEDTTGQKYEDYKKEHPSLEPTEQLTDSDTIYDILASLYVNSAKINNYSGLKTNVDTEYWEVRKALYGIENYKVKIWVSKDENQQRHLYVELNDYLPGFSFEVGESTYTSTVSKKYFDITTDLKNITLHSPLNYYFKAEGKPTSLDYEVNDYKQITFGIINDNTIGGLIDETKELREKKDVLTKDFNNRYSRYIQEGTWSSDEYIDSELYYLDALQISNTSAQPTVSYTINVVEISQLEGFELYNFDTGDKTYVEDTEFFGWTTKNGVLTPVLEDVIVSEVEWHLDEPDKNVITVQNYKTRFEDLFQQISATVQTVQYNESTYAKITSLLNTDGTINQSALLESLNNISGQRYNLTSNGSVIVDNDLILVQDLENKANRVIINSEGIRVSSDGGNTWQTAIDGQGINIGTVYTGTLNTDEVIIGSKTNYSFRWDKEGLNAYGTKTIPVENEEIEVTDLQTYVRFDQYGLYGIKDGETFKAKNIEEVKNKAHFAVTWDGFFIKNRYTDGRVEITTDNDFRVIQTISNIDHERIKIGALEFDQSGNPTKYGININQTIYNQITGEYEDIPVFTTGTDGNITITGVINALGGNFSDLVTVGKNSDTQTTPWIEINGINSLIQSSNYSEGEGSGWRINADGNAYFNNITARGAIKTAVFEYAEIQAVGGIFMFRPSSTIRSAALDGNNLVLTLENARLFKIGNWCKVSNYIDSMIGPNPTGAILNNGLTHVYKVVAANERSVTLENAAAMINGDNAVIYAAEDLVGGALVNMGDVNGENNYGIGINSSDNTVSLPRRAISLFETQIDESEDIKVSYDYKGILGTLPPTDEMGDSVYGPIYQNMGETQGIYTDNMYIGDDEQYLAFYRDKSDNDKAKLDIKGSFHIGDGTLENIINIENGGISLGDTNGFHIFIDGNNTHTYTYGLGFYEENHIPYDLTTDTEVVIDKKYYRKLESGEYEEIENPTGNPSEQGWYEEIDKRIAYINDNKLSIPYTVVLKGMDLGNKWRWELQEDTSNLTLKWMEE